MKNLSVSPIENATRLPSNELDTRLRQAWLLSSRITSTQLASSFLINVGREGLWELTLHETIIQVRPREAGYDQSPLVYAWNELQEILSI